MPSANLFLFTGDDTFTSHNTLKFWETEFQKKYGDFNVQVFENNHLTASEFRNAVNTMPFLSDRKMVIIRDFMADAKNEVQQEVAEQLDNLPEHCIVIFIEHESPDARTVLYKKIAKTGQIKQFPQMDMPELTQWIKKETAGKSMQISTNDASHLAVSVGANLWQMSHEIEKISLYSHDRKITTADIDELISPNLISSIFKLTDALAQKNTKAAIGILSRLLQSGEDIFYIYAMIARQFRILIQVKACSLKNYSTPRIIQKTGEKPFTINQSVSQARNFSLEKLSKAYRRLLDIDFAIKTSKIRTSVDDNSEFRLTLEKFITDLAIG